MRTVMEKAVFAAGLAAILFTFAPPLDGAALQLFSLHMTQHLLVIAVAAPLLIASGVFDRLRFQPAPVMAWIAFVGIFLFWHWPAAFRWSAQRGGTEILEHGSILLGALLFWQAALSHRSPLSDGARALFVLTGALATDPPAVIMVFAPAAICTMPGENALRFGLDPIDDQRIAGLLMWVPANLIFFAIATWLFSRWLRETPPRPNTLSLQESPR